MDISTRKGAGGHHDDHQVNDLTDFIMTKEWNNQQYFYPQWFLILHFSVKSGLQIIAMNNNCHQN
jgi:hypothetical protein